MILRAMADRCFSLSLLSNAGDGAGLPAYQEKKAMPCAC